VSGRSAILLGSLVACGAVRPALTGPEAGGPAWRELKTEHFVLRTDLDAASAREIIEDFERVEQVFIDLSPGMPIPDTTRVLVFARQLDYDAVAPRASSGFFARDPDHPRSPLIVLFGSHQEATLRVLQHELTHRFVAEQIRKPPVWLNEGLASYFETIAFANGKLEVGRSDWHFYSGPDPESVEPVSIEDLLHADAKEFYGPRNYEYSLTAWAFVHMLRASRPGYADRFASYMHSLRSGTDAKSAWTASFGEGSLHDLQVSFNNYITSPYVTVISIPYEPPPVPLPNVRVLTEDEVEELLDWLRAASKASGH
jgi:hypothetical protein